MKKKLIIVITALLLCVLYGVGVYNTYNKYRLPEVEYYGLNDAAVYNGISYKFVGMEVYTLEEICKAYDFTPEEVNVMGDYEKKYYVANFEIEKIAEEGDVKALEVGEYNKYTSGNTSEYTIENHINKGIIQNRKLEIGEKIEYKFVKAHVDYQFSEETFKDLDEDDLWIRIYDEKRECVYYFGTDL